MKLNEFQILSLVCEPLLVLNVCNSIIVLLYFSLPYVYVLVLVSARVGEWNDSDRFISVQVGSLILIKKIWSNNCICL